MANYTILLIDYEPRSIERFREPLIAAGYSIEIATDGVSGIEAFHRLNPDMVLVEAMIPKKHGFEVCQELKRTPHGRQTPVLITTGVYKGRKYRTQALHIYGCDEYIEKPIAPEQLLKIVGKFFGSTASSTPAVKVTESELAPEEDPGGFPSAGPLTSVPRHANVEDGAEDEIIARLDAILPGGHAMLPPTELETLSAATALAETDDDPFAQMRAELNAELGSFSAALAFEPTLAPSDQVSAPSVLETLPPPDAEVSVVPSAPSVPSPSIGIDTGSGQVVDFVAKRGRKNKTRKSGQQDAVRSPKAKHVAPVPKPVDLALPPNTLIAAELEPAAARSGMPAWIWAALGAVAIVTVYFVYSRSGSNGLESEVSRPMPKHVAAVEPAKSDAPAEPDSPPAGKGPLEAAATVAEPPQRVPENSKPSQQDTLVAAPPQKVADRAVKSPAAAAPKPPVVASAAIAKWQPKNPAKVPPKVEDAKATPPEPPPSYDDSVAGVEEMTDLAGPAPATTIEAGTLIPIDSADTAPVAMSHRIPPYPLLARQMRLSGTVVMNVLINERGTVDQVVLVSGVAGAGVNDTALRAAESWTYRPAMKGGVPVKVWKSEQIIFKL